MESLVSRSGPSWCADSRLLLVPTDSLTVVCGQDRLVGQRRASRLVLGKVSRTLRRDRTRLLTCKRFIL